MARSFASPALVLAFVLLLAAPASAQTYSRSAGRIGIGVAAMGAGVFALLYDPPDIVAHGSAPWSVTHEDWTCARNGSMPAGGRPSRFGPYCAAAYTHHGQVYGDRPANRHNRWTRRIADNTTYRGTVHTATDVVIEPSVAQYVAGVALLAAGGALIAFSRVLDTADVDVRLDVAGRRASVSRTVGW